MKKLLSLFITLITFVAAVIGVYDVKDVGGFDNSDWMSEIDGSAYISEISIPGTHDSCALYEPWVSTSKCQEYTVKDQLDMGVRFLDVRTYHLFDELHISHGKILQGQYLSEIIDTCYEFLKENPEETIIISLKDEKGDPSDKKVSEVLDEMVAEDGDKWFVENRIPMLDEVRGKLVLVNRFDGMNGKGLWATEADGWLKNTSFEITNVRYSIFVQDHYNLGGSENIDVKWEEAVELFEKAKAETDERNLYINFMSGYTGLIPDIKEVSGEMNGRLAEYVNDTTKGNYGIVVFDFVDAELCEKIIETNF